MDNGLFTDGLAEAYIDLEKMIYSIVHKHHRTYGGDLSEIMSRANYYFVKAYMTHNGNCASFITWARSRLWNDLFDMMRKDQRREVRVIIQGSEIIKNNDPIHETNEFNLDEFIYGLSERAKGLVDTVLGYDLDIFTRTGKVQKSKLIKQLHRFGWNDEDITETFEEIRRHL